MVTVTGFKTKQAKDGNEFILLELQGGLEMVQSQTTGRFYATVRRCFVSTTFNASIAQSLIGTQMPGKITRMECEPYSYVDESTGEEITLAHRWSYWPEGAPAPMEPVMN